MAYAFNQPVVKPAGQFGHAIEIEIIIIHFFRE